MKLRRFLPHILIFGIFFASGLWGGRQIGITISNRSAPEISDLAEPLPVPPDARPLYSGVSGILPQRTILILGVDQLQASQPALKSAWMVMYLPGIPRLTAVPLFPQSRTNKDGSGSRFEVDLAANFSLTSTGTLSQEFSSLLQAAGLSWDHFIIHDRRSLALLIDHLGGLPDYPVQVGQPRPGRGSRGQHIAAQLPAFEGYPAQSFFDHLQLSQEICRAASRQAANPQTLPNIYHQIAPELISDLTPIQAAAELALLTGNNRLVCEFPSMALAAIP